MRIQPSISLLAAAFLATAALADDEAKRLSEPVTVTELRTTKPNGFPSRSP